MDSILTGINDAAKMQKLASIFRARIFRVYTAYEKYNLTEITCPTVLNGKLLILLMVAMLSSQLVYFLYIFVPSAGIFTCWTRR